MKRLARYLVGKTRVVTHYKLQTRIGRMEGFSDSDWAGCRRTAKSTSGGAIMRGSHCIKMRSSTQKGVTLSSGEAKLVAVVKMSMALIGVMQLTRDWGVKEEAAVLVDSSTALGVVKRKGNGKLRHIKV